MEQIRTFAERSTKGVQVGLVLSCGHVEPTNGRQHAISRLSSSSLIHFHKNHLPDCPYKTKIILKQSPVVFGQSRSVVGGERVEKMV